MAYRSNLINLIFNSTNIVIFAISFWLVWLWRRRHFYKFCWSFPTCWGIPLLGVMPRIKHPDNVLYSFDGMFEETKSDTLVMWCGLYPVLLTKELDFIDHILTKREFLDKAHQIYHPLDESFYGGMITNSAKDWSPIRLLMKPSFKREILLSLFPIFNKRKRNLIEDLDGLANGKREKIMKVVLANVLQLTMETTMGYRATKDKKLFDEFVENMMEAMDSVLIKIFAGFFNLEWLFSFYKGNKIRSCHLFLDKIIEEYIGEKKQCESDDDGQTSNIFIKNAIKLYENNKLSWKQIIGESSTLFAAAFETSASAIYSTFVLLAMHIDIQNKVYEELKQTFPDPNGEINHKDLSQLPYLNIVVKEVMRVIPPAPIIGRHITKNTEYKNWNVVIPEDTQVIISIYHLHRNTKIWGQDAAMFRPSRFLEENLTQDQKKAYIPFSKGYRNCIGYRYALNAIKVLVAGVLLNYRLETDFNYKDLKFSDNVSIRYLSEPFLTLTKRR